MYRAKFYLDGKPFHTEVMVPTQLLEGTEICIEGRYYTIVASILHICGMHPWQQNVHIKPSGGNRET